MSAVVAATGFVSTGAAPNEKEEVVVVGALNNADGAAEVLFGGSAVAEM